MIILGLTGSVGMGKSTTARMLRALKVPVFDADAWVHRAMNKNGSAVAAVRGAFPAAYDAAHQKIDRKKLGAVVFTTPAARKKLEAILHPQVRAAEERFIKRHRNAGTRLIVLDIPLLFETEADRLCDVTLVVTAPAFMQRARVLRRAGMTLDRFRTILATQMPDQEKQARADFIIQTGLGRAATMRDLQRLLHTLKQTYV